MSNVQAATLAAAQRAGVFASASLDAAALRCEALESAEPASYHVFVDAGRLWVALITENRWLSQSIEQDLVHTGDHLHDLMNEELAEQGHSGKAERFEHFRDEQKRFVFRTPIPVDPAAWAAPPGAPEPPGAEHAAATISRFLLACEAMFRPLGDMSGADE